MENTDIQKGKPFIVADMIGYLPNAVANKTIIKKLTGNVNLFSFDTGETWIEKASPFDTFVQVIDGIAEVIVNGDSKMLEMGQAIIIPAHAKNSVRANVRFKMITITIKSGYEEVIN